MVKEAAIQAKLARFDEIEKEVRVNDAAASILNNMLD